MMFQWTDGEVSHIVKLALESVRDSDERLTTSHCSKLVEALAGELTASAWHVHTSDCEASGHDRQSPWRIIAADCNHDWSAFSPFAFYATKLERMLQTVRDRGSAAEGVARRTCQLTDGSLHYVPEGQVGKPSMDEHQVLAWLSIQPDGTCTCVEFLKPTSAGPFTARDEALVRILSTGLLAEPTVSAALADEPELAEMADLPPRQREVLTRLLAGSSVKEIAIDLGISPYTVNDYIKALYRRYHVSSRGELMAAMHGRRRPAVPK